MTIKFIGEKGISERPLVKELVDIIKERPEDFLYIARIFSMYPNNQILDDTEIKNQIRRNFKLAFLSYDRAEILTVLMLEIYKSRKFHDIRAEILENIAYAFGPVTKGLQYTKCYIEPKIEVKGYTVGESDKKCDLVFYQEDLSPMEFIECKTNISNVIPWNKPFEEMSKTHRDKISYLNNAYIYLKENYCEPKIYFACYNEDYENEIKNLHDNLGYTFIGLLSPTEIIDGKHS